MSLFYFIFLLIPTSFALELNERLPNIRIIRVLEKNVVQINRGIEDGIREGEHVRFLTAEGFSARGFCLKSNIESSYWKLYRIPEADRISKDFIYTLAAAPESEIPEPHTLLRDEEFEAPKEKKVEEKKEDPYKIAADLPRGLSEKDLIEATTPDSKKSFIERNFNQLQARQDFKDVLVSLYASPISKQSINEAENHRYGFRGGNVATKYLLAFQFDQQQSRMKDTVTGERVSSRQTQAQAHLFIDKLTSTKSSISYVNYQSTRFSKLGTPKQLYQIGPLGFTWLLWSKGDKGRLDLSYVPLYDSRSSEGLASDGRVETTNTTGLRHGVRFFGKRKIDERWSVENLLWVKPYQDISSWNVDFGDRHLSNDLKVSVSLTEKLFIDYQFIYQHDILWEELSDLPASNTINALFVRYDFNL